MAIDSNFSGDDRATSGSADKAAAAGLKLVSERGGATGTAGTSAPDADRATASPSAATVTPGTGPGMGTTPVGRGGAKAGRQLPLWMFGVLFVLFLLGYGYQTHHAGRLEAEVLRLQESLAKAEFRLESHRTHLLEIRTGVHDLSARLESLRVLIDRDPTAEAAASPTPEIPAPSSPANP